MPRWDMGPAWNQCCNLIPTLNIQWIQLSIWSKGKGERLGQGRVRNSYLLPEGGSPRWGFWEEKVWRDSSQSKGVADALKFKKERSSTKARTGRYTETGRWIEFGAICSWRGLQGNESTMGTSLFPRSSLIRPLVSFPSPARCSIGSKQFDCPMKDRGKASSNIAVKSIQYLTDIHFYSFRRSNPEEWWKVLALCTPHIHRLVQEIVLCSIL